MNEGARSYRIPTSPCVQCRDAIVEAGGPGVTLDHGVMVEITGTNTCMQSDVGNKKEFNQTEKTF
jgi:hypothetical protein